MNLLACDGEVSVIASTPTCTGAWVLVHAPEPFDPANLDLEQLGVAFGVGFTIVATCICIGIGCKAILDFLKGA